MPGPVRVMIADDHPMWRGGSYSAAQPLARATAERQRL
jgi:hypothetical protein